MTKKTIKDKAVIRAVELAGGTQALADLAGVTSQAVSQWNRIPHLKVITIEAALESRITRYEMRPDIYGSR